MANICSNILYISGTINDISNFINSIYDDQKKEFTMMKTVPTETYHERIDKWGEKWDFSDESCCDYESLIEQLNECKDENNSTIIFDYCTAWSPNINFIINVSKQFSNLTFNINYYEEGCGFVGYAIYNNGEELESSENSFSDPNYYDMIIQLGFEEVDDVLQYHSLEPETKNNIIENYCNDVISLDSLITPEIQEGNNE